MIGDVTWTTPGRTSADSLPLGNGDIAANIWTDEDGDILLYLSKSDAWDRYCRLVKIGRLRIRLKPNLVDSGKFEQKLNLEDASITVSNGTTTVRLWCDAHWPRMVVEVDSKDPADVRVELEPWREKTRVLEGRETHSALGLDPKRVLSSQTDTLVPKIKDALAWYQRNEDSIWPEVLKHQSLDRFSPKATDPLIGRTFGGYIRGEDFKRRGHSALVTARKTTSATFTVTVLCRQVAEIDEWIDEIAHLSAESAKLAMSEAWRDHCAWWREFWERSHVRLECRGPDWGNAEKITRQATWHRFMVACCGRGAYPVKFNGALFTADWNMRDEPYDADYRRWGGGYWWQNTRLIYWSMLAHGDYELMQPLFRMYREMLSLAEYRTEKWFGHGGAFFPETLYFWGTHLSTNYGLDRKGKAPRDIENRYIRRYWQSGFELVTLMLETWNHTGDATLLEQDLLPVARSVLKFYTHHYPSDENGRLLLKPAQSLETWWETENPMPEIAGLHYLLPRLLALPDQYLKASDLGAWRALAARLPEIPIGMRDGVKQLLFAAKHEDVPQNSENPELYAVFPYRLYGIGRPDLELALRAYARRLYPDTGGWRQDAIQAAYLGLSDAAAFYITKNYTEGHQPQIRFPGFWGPNYDWIPDFDHGSTAQIALHSMLVQTVGDRIYLFPAWPAGRWNVSFKLHLPGQTTVECELKDGAIRHLNVTPAHRRRDIVVMLDQAKDNAAELPATFSA